MKKFRVGQRVRVRRDATLECAGHTGVVHAVRRGICHVRLTAEVDTFIGVLPMEDLEHIRNPFGFMLNRTPTFSRTSTHEK